MPKASLASDVDILGQVKCYVEYILSHQAADGWLGPPAKAKDGNAPWARSNIILALAMYAEAMPAAVATRSLSWYMCV